jgi:hypothetical protein
LLLTHAKMWSTVPTILVLKILSGFVDTIITFYKWIK